MKLITNLLIAGLFMCFIISCNKDQTPDNIDLTGNVSGRLKRFIQSDPVNRQADITTLEFDGAGRLVKLNEWKEDSTAPVLITDAIYSAFSYSGTNEFPFKNTITDEAGNSDSTIYYYNAQNQVIKEDHYTGSQMSLRNTYAYLSDTAVVLSRFSFSGSNPALYGTDTLVYDRQSRVSKISSYDAGNIIISRTAYQYDNRKNPFNTLNAFHHMYSVAGSDLKYFYKGANNIIFSDEVLPAYNLLTTWQLDYSNNSFPVKGVLTITGNGSLQTYRLKYEYY